ncbi:endonuclease domain-containing 1 protein [Astyanax mexicanus]|uniref:Endonuclease domain-containing 1 protein-like n=2 Tax=Astyanax mexicanus TaxID=7994 RepID=A0A8T2KNE5_ASTMX|nr:endonuclease domain-containing 1 protein [Astyanax mexicanus]KAG9260049.1 endonuclease domain-containing 1 protein-like [Astyanax mexicanus]
MSHNPAVLLVLLLLPAVSLAEVSSFRYCPQFFAGGAPPTILKDPGDSNRYEQICQCLLDQNERPEYFYATLYDTRNKIPVYSAYEFRRAEVERDDRWYVEPQLDGGTSECMGGLNKIPTANRGLRQALNKDYEGSGYDKGHLFPVYHTHTVNTMLATSTLTNAAPQDSSFNRGQWKSYENNVATLLQNQCDESYIVTGVVPGNQQIGDGVRVAQYYWSAYCCFGGGSAPQSAGYIGPDNNGRVQEVSVKQLESILSDMYSSDFSIFQGTC